MSRKKVKTKIMKKQILFMLPLMLAASLLSSCGGDNSSTQIKSKEKTEFVEDNAEETLKENDGCIYFFDEKKYKLYWTAYKFLSKASVNGTFKEIVFSGEMTHKNPKELIESLSFTIPVNQIESGDDRRNQKIIDFFFGSLNNSLELSGRVKSLSDNGKATIELSMNGLTKDLIGDYKLIGNKFNYTAEMDVTNWGAQKGIQRLSKECEDYLTDLSNDETESKLWSDVSIDFELVMGTTNCNLKKEVDNRVKMTRDKCLKLFKSPDMTPWEYAQAICLLEESQEACECMVILSK